jgi:Bacteriophage HK97-gp10, putative tail-component
VAKLGVTLFGLGEFRDALKRLPLELQQEARAEIVRTTESAAAELRAVYPAVTGNLRRGVKTHIRETRGETEGEVRSTAPHAHLWEFGTVNRKTEKGWNRGRMPANITRGLIAIRMRRQRALSLALKRIIERGGDFRITAA